jgi:hypothetical protein
MTTGWQHIVRDPADLVTLFSRLGSAPQPFTVSVSPGEKKPRGLSQNGLFHAWMGEIAKATHDEPSSVKADCHIRWGIPIFRVEDDEYGKFIEAALGGKTRSKVKEMIEAGYVPCTSLMTKGTLSRYMDAVWRHYSPHVALTDPEALKWRPEGAE